MELAGPIFPAEIITLIIGKIDPIIRLSFRAVSLGLMREIKEPARKPTQKIVVYALAREGMYAEALRYVDGAKTTTPAASLLMAACADNNTAVVCSLLNGRLAAIANTAMSSLIYCPTAYNPEVLETIIETVPGLNLYRILSAAISAKQVSLVKFILAKKPRMCDGLCKEIGSSCSLEMLYLLERVWNFPRDPIKTQGRLGTIVAQAVRCGNKQEVIDLISSMLLGGVITPDLIVWRGGLTSEAWTLGQIVRVHGDFAWLRDCGI